MLKPSIRTKIWYLFLNHGLYFLALYVLVITAFIIILGKLFIDGFLGGYYTADSYIYLNASYNPFDNTVSQIPYSYRILTPFLVYILPIDHFLGFILINLLGFVLTGILFYYYLKLIEFEPQICLIGVLILLLSPIMVYTLYNIYLVDCLEYFLLLMSFYAILKKDNKIFIIFTTLGIINKDAALLAIPLYFLNNVHTKELMHTIKSTIIVSILPLTAFLIIKYYFGGSAGYFSIANFEYLEELITFHYRDGTPIIWQIYTPFGLVSFLFLFNLITNRIKSTYLKRSLYLLPFILFLYMMCDIPRATFLAFPIIIPIGLYIFKTSISMKYVEVFFSGYVILVFLVLSGYANINFAARDLIVIAFDMLILSILLIKSICHNL